MPQWDVHFNTHIDHKSMDILGCLAEIKALASVIRGIPLPPYIQERIDSLNIMRAVRGTTGIEGTEASEEEVEMIMQSPLGKKVLPSSRAKDEQEVRNARELMDYITQISRDNPLGAITEEMIREFHYRLTKDIDYERNIPGKYRRHAVQAGDYRPPPTGEEVERLMREFVEWFNHGSALEWDPIIRAIVAHFYIIGIHPFGDGNGRTSRGIESYLLYQAGLTARGFYSLANFYYRKRPEYTRMLDVVRFETSSDLTPFVSFSVNGLLEELRDVHNEVLESMKVISFRDLARETLSVSGKLGTRVGERQLLFLLELTAEPVSMRDIRNGVHPLSRFYRGVTTKTLMRDIHSLQEQGLINVQGDALSANLDVMTQFTALNAPAPSSRQTSG